MLANNNYYVKIVSTPKTTIDIKLWITNPTQNSRGIREKPVSFVLFFYILYPLVIIALIVPGGLPEELEVVRALSQFVIVIRQSVLVLRSRQARQELLVLLELLVFLDC